jgi:hypothetical protein
MHNTARITYRIHNKEREAYFFYAEQGSSTDKSGRDYNPVAIIPKYNRKSQMPEDQKS